jgi:Right handed beta helix region
MASSRTLVPRASATARLVDTAVLAGALGLVALTACSAPSAGLPASHSFREDVTSGTVAHERVPGHPPAAVCGSRGLDGPARPPHGAIVVRHRNLGVVASSHRPGATFWVSPGIHHLGNGPYDQVDPKDRQVFIGAPGAVIDGQHRNLYAFGGTASHVVVSHLTIQNFGSKGDNNNQGVVNHDAAPEWRIRHNTVRHVAGAAVFMGNRSRVVSNCLTRNGQYGFSSYRPRGVHHLVLRHNEISYNNTDAWEALQPNCGCTGGGKFWDSDHVRVLDNWVHHNYGPGLWADTNNSGFLIKGNLITDNQDEGLFYEISYNARIVHNTFARNSWVKGRQNNDFTGAIYLSESGSDIRAGSTYGHRFVLGHNRFVDNWAGIIAWENPDRFSGSPANSSTGYTTLVNPGVATVQACSTPSKIATNPYFDDCRWKVRHLRVQHNRFVFHPGKIPGCTTRAGCGFQGLVSNYGTYPSWSPYQGYVVPDNITFHQDNRWLDNTYVGPWHFEIRTLGHTVSWKTWRSGKYRQDAGSRRE